MSLRVYNRKRKFNETPEPPGKKKSGKGLPRFVIQMHRATRLHHDFRLEFDGVFKSWAVPRGPSLNPLDQRLAVFVEDHPLDYGSFEGIIPKGNYGAGAVMIWDEGTYLGRNSKDRKETEAEMMKGFEKGHMTFLLDGKKLKGEFALIKLKKKGDDDKAWLLVKKRDEHSTYKRDQKLDDLSVKTGRDIDEIAAEAEATGDIWLSKRKTQKVKPSKDNQKSQVEEPRSLETKRQKTPTKKTATESQSPARAPEKSQTRAPIPRKNKPMLATLSRHSVEGDKWLYEPAVDGLRALAEVEGKRVFLYSKSGLPFEKRFPEIVNELKELSLNAVLDGDIVKSGKTATYFIHDLLYIDGRDLRKSPLRERKQLLAQAFKDGRHVKHITSAKVNDASMQVAKNLESSYRSGTTSDWLIVPEGAEPAPKKVGHARAVKSEPRETKKKSTVLPAQEKKSKALPRPTSVEEPRLTNLDKLMFPDDGYTKGDLLKYYDTIAEKILPYLKDRPESLNRQPNGINRPGFYQKDMTGHIPRWLKTTRIFSESSDKSIDYVLCQDKRSLLYIVNLGCIEIHPWFSRVGRLDNPDFLVIDLDPDDNPFDHVIEIAHEVREILEKIGAPSFCKTSGATGIHIGVPTAAKYDFDQVREFAEIVCRIIAKKYPATTSIDRNPNRRRKKIYLDFMQNRRGQTLAAPYCIRPRQGAPVSMPLTWKELKPGLKPEHFNIENAASRILKGQDPWQSVLGPGIDLEKCMQKLKRIFLKG